MKSIHACPSRTASAICCSRTAGWRTLVRQPQRDREDGRIAAVDSVKAVAVETRSGAPPRHLLPSYARCRRLSSWPPWLPYDCALLSHDRLVIHAMRAATYVL